MRFNKKTFTVIGVVLFTGLFFYLRSVLTVDANFYSRMREMHKQGEFSGKVLGKYIDSKNHNTPILELRNSRVSINNDFYNKISIGDSLDKKQGDYNITIFKKGCIVKQLSYKDYFDKLSGKIVYNEKLYPAQKGLLNDYSTVFSKEQAQKLNTLLLKYDSVSPNRIILLTADGSGKDEFKVYADSIATKWCIDLNNEGKTILVVFSKANRKLAISKGKNVTGFSESDVEEIVAREVIPHLKRNEYYTGISKCIDEIIAQWK